MSSNPRFVVIHVAETSSPESDGAALSAAAAAAEGVYLGLKIPGKGMPILQDPSLPRIVAGPQGLVTGQALEFPDAAVLVLAGPGEKTSFVPAIEERLAGVLVRPFDSHDAEARLRGAAALARLLAEVHALRRRAEDQGRELRELNRIGAALSSERNTESLLSLILTKCREITSSDAGSLYLVVRKEGAAPDEKNYFADKVLLFTLTQNDSVNTPFQARQIEISGRSLAGYVALTAERLAIEDAYTIPAEREYTFNRSFDEASKYRTKSLLVIPMLNHKDEVIGVLQLINRKRDRTVILSGPESAESEVIPFDERSAELASSLASQAAVAIENARLYEEIQRLFEGFIRASVTAIESRDPTTSGHSERVARLTVGLAQRVDSVPEGKFREVRFTRDELKQVHYASLLHDFGKIGVRENVLLKGKKLFEHEMGTIQARFLIVRRGLELKCSREKLAHFMARSREEALAASRELDAELARRLEELDLYLRTIVSANEPTVMKEEGSALLQVIAGSRIEGIDAGSVRLLEPGEALNLSIKRGSLSEEERREIESHVTHTFQFLSTIPWTRELRQIPQIAGAHHEKLDGTGYPARMKVDQIPLESKMMTISDIFDALTANDRPYKRAMTAEKALDILTFEVKEGKVDPDLFEIFVKARIYESVLSGSGGPRT